MQRMTLLPTVDRQRIMHGNSITKDIDRPMDASHSAPVTRFSGCIKNDSVLRILFYDAHFFFFFGRERYSLHKCNDNNLKEM